MTVFDNERLQSLIDFLQLFFFETDLRCNVKNECVEGKRRKFYHGNKGY